MVKSFKDLNFGAHDTLEEILDELNTTVGNKANQTDLDAVNQAVTGKAKQADLDNVTTQLAEMATKILPKPKIPFWVENFASFGSMGYKTPLNLANYAGDFNNNGNYQLGITGNVGDSFVTVTSGNIADAGQTTKWSSVIRNDDNSYDNYLVTGTDGASKVYVYPKLKKSLTNGLLANLHDMALGQHYTSEGYKAFANHIYNSKLDYCIRDKFISQHQCSDGNDGKWVITNNPVVLMSNGTYASNYFNLGGNIDSGGNGFYTSKNTSNLSILTENTSCLTQYQVSLSKQKGYAEIFIGCEYGSVRVDFTLDGVLKKSVTVDGAVQRLCFDFDLSDTGIISITPITTPVSYKIGSTTWWLNSDYNGKLIDPAAKVVYIGDSWGMNQYQINPLTIKSLMSKDLGKPANLVNHSLGGMTTNWALDWYDQYVRQEKPNYVIFEYFTNDINGSHTNYTKPDGTTGDSYVSSTTVWVNNIWQLIKLALADGIQPIIIMPSTTASLAQAQTFANAEGLEAPGNNVLNIDPVYNSVTSTSIYSSDVEANGKTDVLIKAKSINSSSRKGVMWDSDVNLTGGDIGGFYNNGTRKSGVKYDGTIDMPSLLLQPQSVNYGASSGTRGTLFIKDGGSSDDPVKIVIKKNDGTYALKYISLEERGTVAPTTGTYQVGDRVMNTAPSAGGYIGWVCVTAGTPGTWKGYGAIQA